MLAPLLRGGWKAPGIVPRPAVPSSNRGYVRAQADAELRQAELITDLFYYLSRAHPNDSEQRDTYASRVPFAFIVTPDCDLLQDYRARQSNQRPRLENAMLIVAESEQDARARSGFNKNEWGKVRTNEIERYHFLEPVAQEFDAANIGISHALVVDFRRYFTLPPSEIERQCQRQRPEDRAVRRLYLSDLWREHLQRRTMSYMQRVALPIE